MKRLLGFAGMFSIGAIGYGIIEIIWRGRTHWSMLTAGGVCFVLLGKISDKMKNAARFVRLIAGSALITTIEFIYGIVFNKILKLKVWDYSKVPFNIMGQICPIYSVLWGFLCIPFMPLAEKVYKKISPTCKRGKIVIE